MYTLTLTHDERKAIDWVGYRYGHGNNLKDLLFEDSILIVNEDIDKDQLFEEWHHRDGDITFHIPENLAWAINNIGEECEFRWDCFAEDLAAKMNNFCGEIV